MATLSFNANEVDPAVGFDAIPAGSYTAIITESEMKPTKTGNGRYLQLTFQIIDGDCKGRLVWARLNLENPSDMAVKIARAELSSICRAVGVMAPRDSLELHNTPLTIRVACKKREDTGEISNEIKGYEGKQRTEPVASAATNGSTPPWKR
jgi:Protein of unknown function (DUF669)